MILRMPDSGEIFSAPSALPQRTQRLKAFTAETAKNFLRSPRNHPDSIRRSHAYNLALPNSGEIFSALSALPHRIQRLKAFTAEIAKTS
jgi:hypothetical protein